VEVRVMSKSTAGSVPQQDSRLPDIGSNTDLMLDLVLLFTMAVHHPAFTYSQRQQLYTSCKKIEKLLNYIPSYKVWAQLFIARSWYLSGTCYGCCMLVLSIRAEFQTGRNSTCRLVVLL